MLEDGRRKAKDKRPKTKKIPVKDIAGKKENN